MVAGWKVVWGARRQGSGVVPFGCRSPRGLQCFLLFIKWLLLANTVAEFCFSCQKLPKIRKEAENKSRILGNTHFLMQKKLKIRNFHREKHDIFAICEKSQEQKSTGGLLSNSEHVGHDLCPQASTRRSRSATPRPAPHPGAWSV